MVYFKRIYESLKVLKNNWKIIIPSLYAFILTLVLTLIFIYVNDLFRVVFSDPSNLFIAGGISAIAKKISAVLLTQSQMLKIIISLAVFVMTNFFVGSGLIAIKFAMIDDALKNKKISLKRSFFGGINRFWHVVEMRFMVFVLIVILSLILSLPFFILSNYFGKISLLVSISIITILLLIRLLLLFRYPIMFKDKKSPISSLIHSMSIFKNKTGYVFTIWLISITAIFVVSLFSELFRVYLSDTFYGLSALAVILISFYVLKELLMVFVNTFVDVFLFVSYAKVRK